MFGLSDIVVDKIQYIFAENARVEKAIVFGSRAKGNYKEGSDIDIAIKGQDLNFDDTLSLLRKLDELELPYEIDLINYETIKESDLKDHIDRVGIELYSRWKKYTLGEISNKITDGAHLSPKDFINGKIMFSVKDMIDNGFDYTKPKTISQEDFVALEKQGCKPEIDDILIAKDGSDLKHIFRVVNEPDYVLLSSIAIIKPKKEIIDPSFLVYTLKNPKITDTILTNFVSGSGVPRIVLKDFKKVDVSVPPLSEQTAIASILGSLDNKIDLLNRQNKTLEQLAETLFRQWFVEAEDWLGTLSEFVKVRGGYAFKSKDFKESGFAGIIKITNISMGFVDINKCDYVDEKAVLNLDEKFKIRTGDFLIAMTGAEIGKIGIVENTNKEIWLNQRVGKLEAKVPYGNLIGYLALKSREGQDHIINACSGSAQENISTTGIEEMVFAKYDEEKAISFGKEASHLFEKITTNYKQIKTLSKTRDNLLPKLMSGEVRVKM